MYFAAHVSMRDMLSGHMKRLFQLAGAMTVSLLFLSIPNNVELVRILHTYYRRNQSFYYHSSLNRFTVAAGPNLVCR